MTGRRLKLALILGGFLFGALTLVSWTQQWFALALHSGDVLTVTGQIAAPALSALGLASLALVAALSIAGRGVRIALGILEVAIGALVATSAATAIADPVRASLATVTTAVGESGASAAAALVASTSASVWPTIAVALGALSALIGVGILVTSRRWPGPTRKYDSTTSVDGSTVGQWDALSKGDDPTG